MNTKRRTWLKSFGLGLTSIALSGFKVSAEDELTDFSLPDILPIRLSSNENPYGTSPLAKSAMRDSYAVSNRYGWDLTADLIEKLATKHQLPQDNILVGAGSTEIIDLTARYAAQKPGNFIIADPGYNNWTRTATKLGLKKIAIPLSTDKKHDLSAMQRAITPDTRLIYICNPNNPTGTICDQNELRSFIDEATKKTLVLVDEAYIDYTSQPSLCSLTSENKNLVIAKTFSKIYGLAGARLGYAIAHRQILEDMEALQSWSNGSVSVVSVAAAIASLKDREFVSDTYLKNQQVRQYTLEQLKRLNIKCIPSVANFVYFSLSDYKGDYFEKLKVANIAGTGIYEENGKWTRITVGTEQEMEHFIAALQ